MLRSLALAAALAVALTPSADAYASYVKLIPNGGNVPDSPNIGHLSADGTTGLNDFGEAYAKTDGWGAELCMEDTDGDGYTNGQELGDPCCTWTTSNTAGLITSGISHPSDASAVPTNAELLAGCATSTTSGSSNSSTSGGDVVAPAASTAGSSSEMPPDDDEDDSDEMAETTGSGAAAAGVSVAAVLIAMAAAGQL